MAEAPSGNADNNAAEAFLQGGSLKHAPGPYFGSYGGRWMPESLIAALDELEETFNKAKDDPEFRAQIEDLAGGSEDLPPTDAVVIRGERVKVVVRPSGTEPKLKCSLEARVEPSADLAGARLEAAGVLAQLRDEMRTLLGL